MKKLIVVIAVICLLLSGCGTNEDTDNKTADPADTSAAPSTSAEVSPQPTPEPVYINIGTVHDVSNYLNIRSGPGTEFDILGTAKQGDRFTVLVEFYSANWHQVEYEGGIAYIHADYLSVTKEIVTEK